MNTEPKITPPEGHELLSPEIAKLKPEGQKVWPAESAKVHRWFSAAVEMKDEATILERDLTAALARAERAAGDLEAISEAFPDSAPHKHEVTGFSLLDDVRDLHRDLAEWRANWEACRKAALEAQAETKLQKEKTDKASNEAYGYYAQLADLRARATRWQSVAEEQNAALLQWAKSYGPSHQVTASEEIRAKVAALHSAALASFNLAAEEGK